MLVYKVTNKINGKVYIGQTAYDLETRKLKHHSVKNTTGYYFHNALNKYGVDNFDWEVLVTCNSQEDMNKNEMKFISEHNSNNREYGYNMTDGGESPLGRKHKESSKRKMSIAQTGRKNPHTLEWNKKIGLAQTGYKNHMYGKYGIDHHGSKKYIITYPDGNEEVIHCLAEFCRNNNLDDRNLNLVASGRRKHHKGFKCRHYSEGE